MIEVQIRYDSFGLNRPRLELSPSKILPESRVAGCGSHRRIGHGLVEALRDSARRAVVERLRNVARLKDNRIFS